MITAKPFEGTTMNKSGIALALNMAGDSQFLRLSFTAPAVANYFKTPITPQHGLCLQIQNTAAERHLLRIMLVSATHKDALPICNGAHRSIFAKIVPWSQMPSGKRPAKTLSVVDQTAANTVVVKLPDWAQPPVALIGQGKGLMD